ncbi:putative uncharacterized protein [Moritella viscosa]|nr:hypothetical protein [Moritella viscosa]CED61987.1 putative uncharacterized protein [Moritella viscosa]SHO07800.1 Putative uncharacterized protein [Moritella viscosa]
MPSVKNKLISAFDALKKEGKKISPYAVEKRAGVANGSCKNHPVILDMVTTEKESYQSNPKITARSSTSNKQIDKAVLDKIEESNKQLRAENDQLKEEMKSMATSVAQLTWVLHRHKSVLTKGTSNVVGLNV